MRADFRGAGALLPRTEGCDAGFGPETPLASNQMGFATRRTRLAATIRSATRFAALQPEIEVLLMYSRNLREMNHG